MHLHTVAIIYMLRWQDGAAAGAADEVPPVDDRKRLEPILTLENAATPLHTVVVVT